MDMTAVVKIPTIGKQSKPRQQKTGSSFMNFGLYEDIIDSSDKLKQENPVASVSYGKSSFGTRSALTKSVSVFKKRTFQMFSDSIQSDAVNKFVSMLRHLYKRIQELNLLKRLDLLIRGIVLSVLNSGQQRIPAQAI